jgi:hypothetical protein
MIKVKRIFGGALVLASLIILSQLSQIAETPSGFAILEAGFPWGLAIVVIALLGIIYHSKE